MVQHVQWQTVRLEASPVRRYCQGRGPSFRRGAVLISCVFEGCRFRCRGPARIDPRRGLAYFYKFPFITSAWSALWPPPASPTRCRPAMTPRPTKRPSPAWTSSAPGFRKTTPRAVSAARCTRASRRSPTAICTSGTPSPSVSISAWPRSSAASAICALTTPIPPRKRPNTWSPSARTCAGWAGTGRTANSTPPLF